MLSITYVLLHLGSKWRAAETTGRLSITAEKWCEKLLFCSCWYGRITCCVTRVLLWKRQWKYCHSLFLYVGLVPLQAHARLETTKVFLFWSCHQ